MPNRIKDIPHAIDRLEALMDVLREQCPWDQKQTLDSLRRYTLEEVHEVMEAIDNEDMDTLKSELGDLLLQIVFCARIASEKKYFSLHDIATSITEKMIRRHPHIFDGAGIDDLSQQWHEIKDKEHQDRTSLMDGIPPLPALAFAQKQQERASRVGFDWNAAEDILAKIDEEVAEFSHEVRQGSDRERLEDEFGDILFALVNLGRKLDMHAELSLMRSNRKFEARFRIMETLADRKRILLSDLDLGALEALYKEAKLINATE
ncbi:MAG: nucleoside triphosphate pyrophosphohydrolase [Mariprofundaceae bacterium]